jgi:peroxin-5
MLGMSHQEHDEDRKAIQCLERAVEEDPYNLDALLALGVSFVNELNSERALRTLKTWVEHNPSFHGMKVEVDAYSDGSLMDEVMQLMIAAQRAAVANGGDDADVQVVLGVLYNVSRDYEAAADAFRAAVRARPDDPSLWNKLGATLANGSRSEQAIPAYQKALELKPKYARGVLNLGISHANLQNYGAAARAYLNALKLNPRATHIWSCKCRCLLLFWGDFWSPSLCVLYGFTLTHDPWFDLILATDLRIAFTCMERFDLVQKTEQRDVTVFDSTDGAAW